MNKIFSLSTNNVDIVLAAGRKRSIGKYWNRGELYEVRQQTITSVMMIS